MAFRWRIGRWAKRIGLAGLAVLVAVVLWVLYTRTRFGFEAQVLGDSPRAARYAGMRTRRKILAVMAISGAIAGLGGASQDGDFRQTLDADPNGLQKQYYGYTGIVVAALGRYNPFAVVVVAVLIGGVEALNLIAGKLGLTGGLWDAVGNLNDAFGMLGYLIIGVFALSWLVSMAVYRLKGYDRLEIQVSPSPGPARPHPGIA